MRFRYTIMEEDNDYEDTSKWERGSLQTYTLLVEVVTKLKVQRFSLDTDTGYYIIPA
jgi:hypothetical protein